MEFGLKRLVKFSVYVAALAMGVLLVGFGVQSKYTLKKADALFVEKAFADAPGGGDGGGGGGGDFFGGDDDDGDAGDAGDAAGDAGGGDNDGGGDGDGDG